MKRFMLIAICVMANLTSISVLAQDSQGQPGSRQRGGANAEKRMKRLDINNDGVISRDEWKGKPEAFAKIDKDGDNSLTREEFEAAPRTQAARFTEMDTNKDGKVSRDEWKGPQKRFGRIDADGDGAITKEELRSARQNRQKN
jgi:Ca2+-binding EF-hand superfamily protein